MKRARWVLVSAVLMSVPVVLPAQVTVDKSCVTLGQCIDGATDPDKIPHAGAWRLWLNQEVLKLSAGHPGDPNTPATLAAILQQHLQDDFGMDDAGTYTDAAAISDAFRVAAPDDWASFQTYIDKVFKSFIQFSKMDSSLSTARHSTPKVTPASYHHAGMPQGTQMGINYNFVGSWNWNSPTTWSEDFTSDPVGSLSSNWQVLTFDDSSNVCSIVVYSGNTNMLECSNRRRLYPIFVLNTAAGSQTDGCEYTTNYQQATYWSWPVVRGSTSGNLYTITSNQIARWAGGTSPAAYIGSSFSWSGGANTPHVFGLCVVGTLLTATIDGAPVASGNDSTLTSGYFGMEAYTFARTSSWKAHQAATLQATGTISGNTSPCSGACTSAMHTPHVYNYDANINNNISGNSVTPPTEVNLQSYLAYPYDDQGNCDGLLGCPSTVSIGGTVICTIVGTFYNGGSSPAVDREFAVTAMQIQNDVSPPKYTYNVAQWCTPQTNPPDYRPSTYWDSGQMPQIIVKLGHNCVRTHSSLPGYKWDCKAGGGMLNGYTGTDNYNCTLFDSGFITNNTPTGCQATKSCSGPCWTPYCSTQ